jgi:hypothetical protein
MHSGLGRARQQGCQNDNGNSNVGLRHGTLPRQASSRHLDDAMRNRKFPASSHTEPKSVQGQKSEVAITLRHVSSTPESRHPADRPACPFRAMRRLMHCSNHQFYSITSSARASRACGSEAQGLGGGQVDDEIEFSGRLDRDVGGLRTPQNRPFRRRAGTYRGDPVRRTSSERSRAADTRCFFQPTAKHAASMRSTCSRPAWRRQHDILQSSNERDLGSLLCHLSTFTYPRSTARHARC